MQLILHADATSTIGAGHIMRCVSLAEAWIELGVGQVSHHGEVTIPFAKNRLLALGIESREGAYSDSSNAVLLVDSYDEGVRRAAGERQSRLKVLVDDLGHVAPGFDVIWNPNAYDADYLYASFSGVVISQQVPIRRDLPHWKRESSDVAVTLGGRIPPDWIVDAIERWAASRGIQLLTGDASWIPASWRKVTADDPWKAFARCSMILTAGGSTVWEAAHVGIPACVLVTAPNQRLIGEWVRVHGVPVIDITRADASSDFYSKLQSFAIEAALLPRLENGASDVARILQRLAAR